MRTVVYGMAVAAVIVVAVLAFRSAPSAMMPLPSQANATIDVMTLQSTIGVDTLPAQDIRDPI